MKGMKVIGAGLVMLGLLGGTATAQQSGIGVGVILGEPTGISLKLFLSQKNAVDLAVGYSMLEEDRYLNFHADYVYHTSSLAASKAVKIPFYFGVGGRVRLEEEDLVGVRVPFGLDFMLRKAPLDIFVEVAPVMEIIPETKFNFEAGIGIRFFLG